MFHRRLGDARGRGEYEVRGTLGAPGWMNIWCIIVLLVRACPYFTDRCVGCLSEAHVSLQSIHHRIVLSTRGRVALQALALFCWTLYVSSSKLNRHSSVGYSSIPCSSYTPSIKFRPTVPWRSKAMILHNSLAFTALKPRRPCLAQRPPSHTLA